jgi:hypothetical protein
MAIERQRAEGARAGRGAGLEIEPGQRIGRDLPLALANLAPGELAVLVAIEADRMVEVAKGDVPATIDAGLAGRSG